MQFHGEKRLRVESVHSALDLPDPKRVMSEHKDSDTFHSESQRVKDDSIGFGHIQDDLLGILTDSDDLTDCESAIQDLNSVFKILNNELDQPTETEVSPKTQPDLGYLLEASDDELGLPPVTASLSAQDTEVEGGKATVSGDCAVEPLNISPDIPYFGFEDEFTSYEFGIVEEETQSDECVLGGLFNYDEQVPSDQSELHWQRGLAADPTVLTS